MKKKRSTIAWIVAAALLLGLIAWTLWSNKALEVNAYAVSGIHLPEAFDGYRIAHVSDLHNTTIGKNNSKLLSLLREANPDMIAITGDMIDSRHTDVAVALEFAQEAVRIAPCYYVTGNHESRLPAEYAQLKEGLLALGVEVLEDDRVALERGGETVTLIGVCDPAFQADDHGQAIGKTLQELREDGHYTILLSHRPELFHVYADNNMDLVLSGHAHGGQFRLPFIGGLIAPHQGLFPQYDGGEYIQSNTHMIVSRGIGNSIIPIRFNNRPEIVLIQLETANP